MLFVQNLTRTTHRIQQRRLTSLTAWSNSTCLTRNIAWSRFASLPTRNRAREKEEFPSRFALLVF